MTRPAKAAKQPPGAKRAPFVLLLLGLVVGGLCALLALNTASAANEVQRHDLALLDQNVAAQLVQSRNDQQASAAPANLARAAEALGMVPAGNPGFLEIGSDGRVHVAGKAAPATDAPLPVPTPTPTHHPAQHKKPNKKHKKAQRQKNKSPGKTKTKTKHTHTPPAHSQPKKANKHHNTARGKHHPQSNNERRAGAPPTTITMPGGPR